MNSSEAIECLNGIRVCLNWKRAYAERWNVSHRTVSLIDEIRGLYIPWYRANGVPCECAYRGATPVKVGQVADDLDGWPHRSAAIHKYVCIYRMSPSPLRLMLPVYDLPRSETLLLDGSHRAVALILADVSFEVALLSIQGPIDSNALPDLQHFKPVGNGANL